MLPTSGLFKDIDCPYYDNYCGRPYCHFRHRKRNVDSAEDSQDGELATAEFPTYRPTPKSQLAQAKSHIPISYVPDTVLRPERLSRVPSSFSYPEKIVYKPTPLSELSKNNAASATAELHNSKLLKTIEEKNVETAQDNKLEDDNCDIDFEQLSTEFDMIDDIINECPSQDKTERDFPKEEKQIPKEEKKDVKHKSKSSRQKSKSCSEKNKEEKSKYSKPSSSSSSSRHKSSHKSKTHHRSRSRSRERHKTKSETHKDAKKEDQKHKSSSKSKSDKSKHEARSNSRSKERLKHEKDKKHAVETVKEVTILNDDFLSDNEDRTDLDDIFNDDLEEECYRIFNEYKPEEKQDIVAAHLESKHQQGATEEYVPTAKKRVAHSGAEQYIPKVNTVKLKPSQNAALQLNNRYKIARKNQVSEDDDIISLLDKHGSKRENTILETYKNIKKAKMKVEKQKDSAELADSKKSSGSLIDDILNGSNTVTYNPTPISKLNAVEEVRNKPVRIAPAMNATSIQQAKARMLAEAAKKRELAQKTPIQTIGKGNKRVAHIPDASTVELPDVLQPESKKIPLNVRTRYLNMIAEECVKLFSSKEDAYSRAVNEEVKVLERCAAIVTYRNSAMLAVNRIRKERQDREAKGLGPICGESAGKNEVSQFKGKRFYENIMPYVLKEEDLIENGYPREGPIPGKAVIKNQRQLPRVNLDENQRLCCRCFKVYLIDRRGFPKYAEDCLYHPLKKRTIKGDRIYLCCKSTEDTGCMTSSTHVSESDDTDLLGYQTTMDPDDEDARNHSTYALDCEMCYTTKGLELTRVTIVDAECKTVYESLVKPLNPIIDYNTQFSGITKEQMDRTGTSILQVQANILHLCNSRTVLIGHSLESDMKALKIVHSRIVDTAVLFPHRLGPPHKRALRNLASEYLNKIIQSDVGGHDSAEDAITCMELVIWKLKEDLKVRGIK